MSYREENFPALSGGRYKALNVDPKKKSRSLLIMYPGLFDTHLAHGWLGDLYGAWQLSLALLYLAMFSTGVQLGYFSILIPLSIEGLVVLVGNAWVAYLAYRADKSQRYIVRHKVDITPRQVRLATVAKANADNDQTLYIAGFFWNVVAFFLMVVFATSITVTPNLVDGAPALVQNYNLGLLDNFKMPIKPDANGNVNVIFLFLLLLLIKSAHLTTVFFSRTAPVALRGKLNKIDAAIDEGRGLNMTDTKNVELATASRQQTVMIGA